VEGEGGRGRCQTLQQQVVAKVAAILRYYEVPFEYVPHMRGRPIEKGGSYKKIPVLKASGRTITDSYVIAKILLEALAVKFDDDLEQMITFGLQPAIEAECFADPEDFRKYDVAAGYLAYPDSLLSTISPSAIRKAHPDLKPSVEYGSSPSSTASRSGPATSPALATSRSSAPSTSSPRPSAPSRRLLQRLRPQALVRRRRRQNARQLGSVTSLSLSFRRAKSFVLSLAAVVHELTGVESGGILVRQSS